jgi:hypothetical protein
MILAAVALSLITAVLVAVFVAFFLYSRTPAWRSSELRMATLRFLAIVGPMFGARVDMPEPTPSAISTPGRDPDALAEPQPEPGTPSAPGRPPAT